MGTCCIAQRAQLGARWSPRGVGSGREVQEGGDICVHMAESLPCTGETNTTLYGNYILN